MPKIDALFQAMIDMGGSDLHMLESQPPKIRVHGHITALDHPPLTRQSISMYLSEISGPERWKKFVDTGDLDFAYSMGEAARFRVNFYKQMYGFGSVCRLIPFKIKTLEDLKVPLVLKEFAHMNGGLVLVTGPTGSGKSTTLAAIMDYINNNFSKHILTIEEPIEFVHKNKKSIFVQREVGVDCRTFGSALKVAFREDVDVILVGEMRDLETISLAITAASTGVLVFGTLHTNCASKTVDRIIDVFPTEQQNQIRTMLAISLKGICAQLLMRTADGKGRMAVNEVMLSTPALSGIIRDGKTEKINDIIRSGKAQGMQLMDDCILGHLKAGRVTPSEAFVKAVEKGRFAPYLTGTAEEDE